MSEREWAETETIEYKVEDCGICGTEVAVDNKVPEDSLESNGYVAVISEGETKIESETKGNWDSTVTFEADEKQSTLPPTTAFVICKSCGQDLHQHPKKSEKFQGEVPDELSPKSHPNVNLELGIEFDNRTIAYLTVAVSLFILLLIIL